VEAHLLAIGAFGDGYKGASDDEYMRIAPLLKKHCKDLAALLILKDIYKKWLNRNRGSIVEDFRGNIDGGRLDWALTEEEKTAFRDLTRMIKENYDKNGSTKLPPPTREGSKPGSLDKRKPSQMVAVQS
jgi:hypothetical protein